MGSMEDDGVEEHSGLMELRRGSRAAAAVLAPREFSGGNGRGAPVTVAVDLGQVCDELDGEDDEGEMVKMRK